VALALNCFKKNYGLGAADPLLAADIMVMANKFGFSQAPLQCFDQAVPDSKFETASEIINGRI